MAIFRQMLKSKIHGAVITKKELHYSGSIGIDVKLLKESDILPGEKVQVLNFNNGERFETYAIEEKGSSDGVALYGPAARMGEIGDKVCVISYAVYDEAGLVDRSPKIVILDRREESGENIS